MSTTVSSSIATVTARPSAKEVLAAVRDLQPWLREQQAAAENECRIPQETIERLDEAGVVHLTKPKRYGGADFTTRELHDIYRALGSGCGATAWVVWATAGGNQWSSAFADDVVAPVYQTPWVGNRTFAVGGTSRRMSGTASRVDGGWMVKGAWPFATGSVHASHGYLAVFYDETDDSKVGMVLVPKASLRQMNDWDAMGLAATGSQTMATDGELFVPDERFGFPAQLAERLSELMRSGIGPRRGGLPRSMIVEHRRRPRHGRPRHGGIPRRYWQRSVPYSPYRDRLTHRSPTTPSAAPIRRFARHPRG